MDNKNGIKRAEAEEKAPLKPNKTEPGVNAVPKHNITAQKPPAQAESKAPTKNIQKIDYSKRTRSYRVHKIVSTIICAVVSIALIAFFAPLLVDALTTVPDPEAEVDLSGFGNAIYAVLAMAGSIIALVFYIPSTTLGAMGFVATLKRYKGKEKIGDKIWFGILTFLPFLMEILLLISIVLVL